MNTVEAPDSTGDFALPNSVELIGTYGGDKTHALSAWTSTGRDLTPEKEARIGGLLKMLAENNHGTPFEKSTLHFLVTCDVATHIHILKHRAGVAANGESARYREYITDKAYVPDDWPEHLALKLQSWNKEAFEKYHSVLEELEPIVGRKRAKESARFFLPYSTQLTLDVSFNWRSFAHFYNLRAEYDENDDPVAQKEVCDIAEQMLQLIKETHDFDLTIKAYGYE